MSKCNFFQTRISYLGHVVSGKCIETDSKKTAAIRDWPQSKTVTNATSFLGFTNYYQKFIDKYTHVVKPLNRLISGVNSTKKKSLVEWDDECQEAFTKLKGLCSDTPMLTYAGYLRPFKLHTDASEVGLKAVLCQVQYGGMERVIAYASHTLSKSRYYMHKLEFLTLQ